METQGGAFIRHFQAQPLLADRFKVLDMIGDGAMGFVYHVIDRLRGDREVALKVLASDQAFDQATFDRFLAELRTCQTIRHPNLVEAYDLIEMGDTVAYTMEFVDGGSLQSLFVERKMSYSQIDKIIYQVLCGVQAIHDRGIVHRDLKLENVLIRSDGTIKIADLGLMKKLGQRGDTNENMLLGTPQYMPPEYVKYSEYSKAGDIYTCGLMLYEMLTGKRWLNHLKGQDVINYLIKTRFHVSRASLTGVPDKYLKALSKALDPNPEARFQSAKEMQDALCGRDREGSKNGADSGPENKGGLAIQDITLPLVNKNPLSPRQRFIMRTALSLALGISLSIALFSRF